MERRTWIPEVRLDRLGKWVPTGLAVQRVPLSIDPHVAAVFDHVDSDGSRCKVLCLLTAYEADLPVADGGALQFDMAAGTKGYLFGDDAQIPSMPSAMRRSVLGKLSGLAP